jgi:hypothetical protein
MVNRHITKINRDQLLNRMRFFYTKEDVKMIKSVCEEILISPESPEEAKKEFLLYKDRKTIEFIKNICLEYLNETCGWTLDHDSYGNEFYLTVCGQGQSFAEGTIDQNGYEFCPFCGNEIEEVKK